MTYKISGANTWLPEHGDCVVFWDEFPTKAARDFKASKLRKSKDVLKVTVGEFSGGLSKDRFYVSSYFPRPS